MARIVVIGGTGYAGGHIAAEAAARGHDVVSVSRKAPETTVPGVTYVQGTVLDLDTLADTYSGADVVVSALSPRGDMTDGVPGVLRALAARLAGTATRLGVVGGAMGSLAAPGGPRLWDELAEADRFHEGAVGVESLELLEASDQGLDWFLVHPPKVFGSWEPGERVGAYRVGGDVVVTDAAGASFISGPDFATAFVDEIEVPRHHRARFTVGY